MLTKEQELKIGETIKYSKDDTEVMEARNKLYNAYENMAYKISNDSHKQANAIHYDKTDLYQDALLALWSATEDYDPDKNAKFSTFVFTRIKKAVSTAINHSYSVKVGNAGKDRKYNLDKAIEEWNSKYGEDYYDGDMIDFLSERTNESPFQIYQLQSALQGAMSIDNAYTGEDGEGLTFDIEDKNSSHDPFELIEIIDYIDNLKFLSEEEKKIFNSQFVDHNNENYREVFTMQEEDYKKALRNISKKIKRKAGESISVNGITQ